MFLDFDYYNVVIQEKALQLRKYDVDVFKSKGVLSGLQ